MTKISHTRFHPASSGSNSRTASRIPSKEGVGRGWLLTALASSALMLSACADGLPQEGMDNHEDVEVTQQSIINGDAITETTPFVKLAQINGALCSGTLINADTVLTASHCITDGTVTTGKSWDLDAYSGNGTTFFGISDHTADDIVATAIASDDHVYYWYDDYEVSSGTTRELTKYRSTYSYSLPPGKTPSNIVGIAIGWNGSKDVVWSWYDDYTVYAGSTSDLDSVSGPIGYSVLSGKSVDDIVGIAAIPVGSGNRVYTWYDDGAELVVSQGTFFDLGKYSHGSFTTAIQRSADEIVGIGIAKSNSRVYTWYKDGGESNNPLLITIQSGGHSAPADAVIRHPDLDVAIIRSRTPFDVPNDSQGGTSWPVMYTGTDPALLNDMHLDCYGYGNFTYDGGSGTLRHASASNVGVKNSQQYSFEVYPITMIGQVPNVGDSGGGCFLRLWGNVLLQMGVVTRGQLDPKGKRVLSATLVPVAAINSWIQDND